MGYVRDNLMPDERIYFSARLHWAVFLPAGTSFLSALTFAIAAYNVDLRVSPSSGAFAAFLLFTSAMFAVLSMMLTLPALILVFMSELAVTDRRVIGRTGLLWRRTLEIPLSRVESVTVRQTIVGRLLNFGIVTVTGEGGRQESFQAIVAPAAVRMRIQQILQGHAPVPVPDPLGLSAAPSKA